MTRAGTILFLDIVGYSKKAAKAQRELVPMLNRVLLPKIRKFFNLSPSQLICLPTGDGIALAFLHPGRKPKWSIEDIVDVIFELQRWSQEVGVALRIGLHAGQIDLVKDINGRQNVCGPTVNMCQRIMDAAGPRQVMFSDEVVRQYVGETIKPWRVSARLHSLFRLEGPFEVQVKHGVTAVMYRLLPDGLRKHGWNANDPELKFWLSMKPTDARKPIVGLFSARLKNARKIALVQETGKRLLAAMKAGKVRLSKDLEELTVLMPSSQHCLTPSGRKDTASAVKYKAAIRAWRQYAKQLKRKFPRAQIEIRRFDAPLTLGASYIDWDRTGGQIHVSTLIWGIPPEQCPGFDIHWIGREQSPIYKTYAQGLAELRQQSKLVG